MFESSVWDLKERPEKANFEFSLLFWKDQKEIWEKYLYSSYNIYKKKILMCVLQKEI